MGYDGGMHGTQQVGSFLKLVCLVLHLDFAPEKRPAPLLHSHSSTAYSYPPKKAVVIVNHCHATHCLQPWVWGHMLCAKECIEAHEVQECNVVLDYDDCAGGL